MHSTDNLKDGYLGSGTRLKRSIRRHGAENFKIEILRFFESRALLVEEEKKVVSVGLLEDPLCMNLRTGGEGGFFSKEHKEKVHKGASTYMKLKWKDPDYRSRIEKVLHNNLKENHRLGKIKRHSFLGQAHKESSKRKMSESKKNTGLGESNSQYGTKWIHNPERKESKKIKANEDIPQGWKLGRKLKF